MWQTNKQTIDSGIIKHVIYCCLDIMQAVLGWWVLRGLIGVLNLIKCPFLRIFIFLRHYKHRLVCLYETQISFSVKSSLVRILSPALEHGFISPWKVVMFVTACISYVGLGSTGPTSQDL